MDGPNWSPVSYLKLRSWDDWNHTDPLPLPSLTGRYYYCSRCGAELDVELEKLEERVVSWVHEELEKIRVQQASGEGGAGQFT